MRVPGHAAPLWSALAWCGVATAHSADGSPAVACEALKETGNALGTNPPAGRTSTAPEARPRPADPVRGDPARGLDQGSRVAGGGPYRPGSPPQPRRIGSPSAGR